MAKENGILKSVVLSVSGLTLLFAFQNCSNVEFSQDLAAAKTAGASGGPEGTNPDGNNPSSPDPAGPTGPITDGEHNENVEEVRASCNNKVPVEKTVQVHFPKPTHTCAWNQDGNLKERNEYFQARIEQTALFDLPAGAKICDMQFNFAPQSMRYDDHFIMAFNGAVLASSYRIDDLLSQQNGVYKFNWGSIVGEQWITSKETVYCHGENKGLSSCTWPDTDTPGTIEMQYKPQLIQEIMAFDLNRTQHEFKFVTIGDNDEWDCEHSDLKFSVKLKYVQ